MRFHFYREKSKTAIDDPKITEEHAKIIRKKVFLRNLYTDFYTIIKLSLGSTEKKTIVELGSGGGFIKEIIPNVITSDIMKIKTVDRTFSATKLPFKRDSIDALVMINVLHHIADTPLFFKQAQRCLKKNGKIIMIEPANTLWGRFIYKHFHYEPFIPEAAWKFRSTGPLSGANDALPWIIFFRDRMIFEKTFPSLRIKKVEPHTPFRWIISGGTTFKQLLPSATYAGIKKFENYLKPWNTFLGMFYTITLEKVT